MLWKLGAASVYFKTALYIIITLVLCVVCYTADCCCCNKPPKDDLESGTTVKTIGDTTDVTTTKQDYSFHFSPRNNRSRDSIRSQQNLESTVNLTAPA